MRSPGLAALLWLLPAAARAGLATAGADLVLGQPLFTTGGTSLIDASSVANDIAVAVDTVNGRAFVSDPALDRVLVWNSLSGLTNGQAADVVLGQPDFSSSEPNQGQSGAGSNTLNIPTGVAADGSGGLWVSDFGNHRVLMFAPPFSNDMSASLSLGAALGAPASPSAARRRLSPAAARARLRARRAAVRGARRTRPLQAVGAASVPEPSGLAFDASGRLWVSDTFANRVLRFSPPFSAGMSADLVLGQPDFVSDSANLGQPGPTAGGLALSSPWLAGLAVDASGTVWVADYGNARVVGYGVPISSGMDATLLLGATSFSSTPTTAVSSTTIPYPEGLAADASGTLWVADTYDDRVLQFAAAITSGAAAAAALGQANLSSGAAAAASASTFSSPFGVAVDASGGVWIADQGNLRVLRFPAPVSTGESANLVLGQPSLTQGGSVNAQDMNGPSAVVVDAVRGRVYVSDTNNSRVLWFNGASTSAFSDGEAAAGVLGQANLFSNASPSQASSTTLSSPHALAVDGSGAVWVADFGNNRVLRYSLPLSTGQGADLVLGQPDFASNQGDQGLPSVSSQALLYPAGLAIDASSHVWVADGDNARVLRFSPPFSNGMGADLALGQSDLQSAVYLGVPAQNAFGVPAGLALDAAGGLWVADTTNNRVLRFAPPFSTGMNASLVLGEPDFVSANTAGAATASLMLDPAGMAFDPAGNIWVSDTGDERVLAFVPPFADGASASFVLGQTSYSSSAGSAPTAASLSSPGIPAFDAQGNFWVPDAGDSRVLEFGALTSSASAALGASSATVSLATLGATFVATLPAGLFSQPSSLSISTPTGPLPAGPPSLQATGIAVQIVDSLGLQPLKPFTLSVTYSPGSLGAFNPSRLALAFYDPSSLSWTTLPSSDSPGASQVSASVQHLSLFEVFQGPAPAQSPPAPPPAPPAGLSNVHAYPNPYKPGSGGPYDNSSLGTGVVFEGLATNSRIRVFTLSGEEVADLSVSAPEGKALWNIRNKSGDAVASGVYIFLVTNLDDASQKATGRLAIIK